MSPKRVKKITREEFSPIANRRWVPVALVGDGRPAWMHGIPKDKVQLVLASGTFIDPRIVEADGLTISVERLMEDYKAKRLMIVVKES